MADIKITLDGVKELDSLTGVVTEATSGAAPPTLLKATILEVVNRLREIEKWNGYSGIAKSLVAEGKPIKKSQVKEIDNHRRRRISELQAATAELE